MPQTSSSKLLGSAGNPQLPTQTYLGQLLNISETQFADLKNGDNHTFPLIMKVHEIKGMKGPGTREAT